MHLRMPITRAEVATTLNWRHAHRPCCVAAAAVGVRHHDARHRMTRGAPPEGACAAAAPL
eukprot:6372170-Prymnesium_polylepis.1